MIPIQTKYKCAIILLLVLLSSCEKEEVMDMQQDTINFSVVKTEEVASSRGYGEYAENMVLRSADSADTLAMNVYIDQDICTDVLPESRGAAITRETLASFGVYTSQTEGSTSQSFFSNLEVTRDVSTGVCTTKDIYYWPGADRDLSFRAIAPYNPTGLTVNPSAGDGMPVSLAYTVPQEASQQSDVMITDLKTFAGNYKQTVPLTFRHLCSAVNVKVGSIPQGTIKSIIFKNIYNKGMYTIADDAWSVDNTSRTDFAVDFTGTSDDYSTTGSETGNPQINDANATFMMIPQTLPGEAEIQIVYVHGNTGREETLSASLKDTEWEMGQTYNYLISITPDYILDFTTTQVAMQDAHYVMVPLQVKANYLADGWTLTGTASDDSKVTFRDNLTTLQAGGYWIDDDRGDETLVCTTQGDAVNVYAFLEENVSEKDRTITLSLRPASDIYKDEPAKTLEFTQLCPSWNTNGLGCERIEDGTYPWGFMWGDNLNIVYTVPRNSIWTLVLRAYLEWFSGYDYITTSGGLFNDLKVTIKFNEISATGVATSETAGLDNTKSLYNFDGVSDATDLMNLLEDWGGTPDKVLPTNPTDFAARSCAMKNKYNKTSQTPNGQTIDTPVLKDENFVWYLPAKNEITGITDTAYPMTGTYWTSTSAPTGNEKAYKYTVGGITEFESRDKALNVRAVRKKPQ